MRSFLPWSFSRQSDVVLCYFLFCVTFFPDVFTAEFLVIFHLFFGLSPDLALVALGPAVDFVLFSFVFNFLRLGITLLDFLGEVRFQILKMLRVFLALFCFKLFE